ncbi:hypothetical protein CAAN1_02S02014 [[Candida] anglica]|uniref:Uncharacterized protein n=1 Tax=[Candida] anglica TaxID=148631 RepID=A0ABP0E6F5_9ASCO
MDKQIGNQGQDPFHDEIPSENESEENFFQFAKVEDPKSNNSRNKQQELVTNFDSIYQPPQPSYQPYGEATLQPINQSISNESSIGNGYIESNLKTNNSAKYRKGSKTFLLISIVSAILVLLFEVYMYAVINIHKKDINSTERYTEMSIYLSLFIFASLYQVALTILGLREKNMLLLTSLCIFYCCMLVYTGIQFQEVHNNITEILEGKWKVATAATNIATIAVLGFTLISQAWLIFFVLRKDVSWFQYKKIGGDIKIRRMYNIFQVHRSLLIFDFFFFIGFTVQFLVIMVADKHSVEFILTVCVLPITLIVLFLSDFATTRELLWVSLTSIALFSGGCAYVLFKMIRLYTKYTSAYNEGLVPGEYFPGRKSLITFGAITLALLICTIVIEAIMVCNYNKGLLPVVSKSWSYFPGFNSKEVYRTPLEMDETNMVYVDRSKDGSRRSGLGNQKDDETSLID